jgi:hypothetical protein
VLAPSLSSTRGGRGGRGGRGRAGGLGGGERPTRVEDSELSNPLSNIST